LEWDIENWRLDVEILNGMLDGLVSWVRTQPGVALLSLFTVNALTLVLALWGLTQIHKLRLRQSHMLRGVDGASLENLLVDYSGNVTRFQGDLENALTSSVAHEAALHQTLRRIGLYRYDALANVGGQQSFSLALLDEGANGVVLTSLHTRQEMRLYAKPVRKGRSEVTLTPEEQRAISQARVPAELE
jgi:Protein of unknown function (DUF4446)